MGEKKKDRVTKVLAFLSLLLLVWLFVSFIEVNIKNGDLDPHYSSWNFFEITMEANGYES